MNDNDNNYKKVSLLVNEANIAVGFVSFLFAVNAIFLSVVVTRENFKDFMHLSIYPVAAIIGCLYSCLFYANASGEVTRYNKFGQTELGRLSKAIEYGDIVSEYIGVYSLIGVIPPFIYYLSKDLVLTIIVLLIDITGFIFYQVSGFAILFWHLRSKINFIAGVSIFFMLMTILQTALAIISIRTYEFIVAIAFQIGAVILSIYVYRRSNAD
ncbi:MAG: hypothetical protein AB1480_12320 [Nitrospirota bacterium]